MPAGVRAIWRDHLKTVWGNSGGIDFEGTIMGDNTDEVAQRIPDAVLSDVRARGGDSLGTRY